MQPVKQLVRVTHGSHLYGTSTPASDRDFKGVHLPSGEGIILGRAEDVIERDVRSKIVGTDKNATDAVDEQSYSLQKFFGMLMKGDTVATEILFAPQDYGHQRWREVQAVGKQLLNRQCKGFVGYCVRQAAKYGIKGSRMAAVRSVLDTLETIPKPFWQSRLRDYPHLLDEWSEGREHVSWENIPSPDGSDLWHLNVCDRKMPVTATIAAAYDVWNKVWENYGQRARDAMNNENIDWKAMSHAVRVAEQAIELLDTGHITFPRPNADLLRDIKLGGLPYDLVSHMLEERVRWVQVASERSQLPEKSDPELADALVRRLYLEQTR